MTATVHATSEGPPWHAGPDEYRQLVETRSPDPGYHERRINHRQRFVDTYPDLNLWQRQQLAVRIGRLPGEQRHACTSLVDYEARTYLVFLGLTGRLRLDYDWLLAMPYIGVWQQAQYLDLRYLLEADAVLAEQAGRLGYHVPSAKRSARWLLARLALHTGKQSLDAIHPDDIIEIEEAIEEHSGRPDLSVLHGSREYYLLRRRQWRSYIHTARVLLFHAGSLSQEPAVVQPSRSTWPELPDEMCALVQRYCAARRLMHRPTTMQNVEAGLRRFTRWLREVYPDCAHFADVGRAVIEEYMAALCNELSGRTGRPLSPCTRRSLLQAVHEFFRDGCAWGWEGMPVHSPISPRDFPRIPLAVPRFIQQHELDRITATIRELPCPIQRASLLVARWCGARRSEIRRLDTDCLDAYPDGTPRLRIPAGKTYRERMVPLNPEAADALREIIALRARDEDRPFTDTHSSRATRYLFLRHGKLVSIDYLFSAPLKVACTAAGLVTSRGTPTVSAHRFRHTVGTQLAERGARLHTIMAVLGHRSASMSLVYAQISDQTVLNDYESVLGPAATIAGPYADEVRTGALDAAAVDWLKTNFLKTELELGRCLRLPQEGPCECDLALSCAKFVTTPAYVPRLRERRTLELELIADAEQRGWHREIERHRSVVHRIDQLLTDLGETHDAVERASVTLPSSCHDRAS